MDDSTRLVISLPTDMAAAVEDAVQGGDYASNSDVVCDALRDWRDKRALQLRELALLKADIDRGLADLGAGRLKTFDSASIIEQGRRRLVARSPSS